MSVKKMYHHHEQRKKAEYNRRVLDVEKGCFTPLVFSTTGGMAPEAQTFFKRMAEKIAMKKDLPYPQVASFVRRRVRFDLVKTTLIALRGFRGKVCTDTQKISELDLHLETKAF